jgi:hypothetical protein
MDLENDTAFAALAHPLLDGDGREKLLVVVKATFELVGGKPRLAEEQPPVLVEDAYRGEPGKSSLLAASDLVPRKPATDLLVEGRAYTQPSDRTSVLVAIRLGPITKGVRVFGDRSWQRGLSGLVPSAPKPFESVEVTWERAFGGTDETAGGAAHPDNPVGVGFRGKGSTLPTAGAPLPNVEAPAELLRSSGDRPPPAGLGPVQAHWRSRALHAGTMDDRWRKDRAPFPPQDFDPRYWQYAPPDQILPRHLSGGEPLKVVGMTPDGPLELALPRLAPAVVVGIGVRDVAAPPGACDTVVVDSEKKAVTLVWRTLVDVHGSVPRLSVVHVAKGTSDGG